MTRRDAAEPAAEDTATGSDAAGSAAEDVAAAGDAANPAAESAAAGRDVPQRLLAAAVRRLPAGRREWGTAMLAELNAIDARPDRWRFATGCVAALTGRRAFYLLAPPALVIYVAWWSASIGWAPRRWGVVAFAAVLAIVAELGMIGPLGPVASSRAARFTRAVSFALVGLLAGELVHSIAEKDNNDLAGVPILSLMLAGYLAGALAVTSRRAAVESRTLLLGLAGGGVATAAWTASAFLFPPLPHSAGPSMVFVVAGMTATAVLDRRRGGLTAALTAAATGAPAMFTLVVILASIGPDQLIPLVMPLSLPLAVQVSESRIELVDPYLWLLLFGWFVALAQWAVARLGTAESPAVAGPVHQQNAEAA